MIETNNILVFEINKTNTKLLAENSMVCYIIGIGKTNYTVHREADEIRGMYFPKYTTFKGWSIKDFHTYHVFQSRLRRICSEIRFRSSFKHKGQIVNVKRAYIGVPDYCEIEYHEGRGRTFDKIVSKGNDYKESSERLKYIVEVQ